MSSPQDFETASFLLGLFLGLYSGISVCVLMKWPKGRR